MVGAAGCTPTTTTSRWLSNGSVGTGSSKDEASHSHPNCSSASCAPPPETKDARSISTASFSGATFRGDAWFDGATLGNALFHGATFKGNASFKGATFTGNASFHGATVKRNASFKEAKFTGKAWFGEATFTGDASFSEASFTGTAGFTGATLGKAFFDRTTFEKAAKFDGVTFTGNTSFKWAKFERNAWFKGAKFTGEAWFDPATFRGDAWFDGATFKDGAWFHRARVTGHASFPGVTFERARQLGPMVVRERLSLDEAVFHERIRIEANAGVLSCERARFLAGVQLRVRWAQVVLDDADLAAPSVLSGAGRFPGLDEVAWLPRAPDSPWPVDPDGTPRLLSVRGADVAGLTVAGVDLQACRFVDAHHLDQLRAEASKFADTPRGWRWTKRRTIAEEQQWRASQDDGQSWYGLENRPPEWLELKPRSGGPHGTLLPGDIARLYRDLRKGLEDSKDEPGAADFYYGEMEMRRHDKRQQVRPKRTRRSRNGESVATTGGGISSIKPGSSTETDALKPRRFGSSAAAEYVILTLYWLVSGYGLRAWRALTSLAVVVVVASVIFAFWGFAAPDQPAFRPVDVDAQGALVYEPQQDDRPAGVDELPTALRFSAQATTALLRGPDSRALTAVGEWLQIALRLAGPVLLGLAVLSVRGRVKR